MSKSRNEQDAPPLSDAERAHFREGFTRLLPTPELETAVQEIAANAPTASSPWKGRLGMVATLAVAAAVLFALYVPKSEDGAPAGPGDPIEATTDDLVVSAPSEEEVSAARTDNQGWPTTNPPADVRLLWRHKGRVSGNSWASQDRKELLRPHAGAHHRWVARTDDLQFNKPDEFDFGMPPADGRMLVGAGILNKLGGLASFDQKTGALVVKTKNGEWRALPKSSTAEIEISSPEPGGATARIRIGISTAYEGSVMLEEPLARALGLHHFEHPRRALLGGKLGWRATQSYARIRIPSVQFDETLLVQVKAPGAGQLVPKPSPPETRMTIRGVVPNRVAHADELRYTREGGFEVTDQDSSMTLGLRASRGPGGVEFTSVRLKRNRPMEVALVYDRGHTGLPDAYVFAGRFDARPDHPIGPDFTTKWCEVRLPKAPGARVTIARVWRGSVAIPSREGVTITWADERGRVRCPRIVGEAPAPLRMLVEPKHGKPFFHTVQLDPRSGTVKFDGPKAYLNISPQGQVIMSGAAPKNQVAPRSFEETLLDWFKQQTAKQPRTDTGISQLAVHVTADNQAPLSKWLQILTAASHPDVKVRRFKLSVLSSRAQRRDAGRTVTYTLPSDRGLSTEPSGSERKPLRISLRGDNARATVHFQAWEWEAGLPVDQQTEVISTLREKVSAALSAGRHRPSMVLLSRGLDYPMHAVALVLEALDGLKLESIGFEVVR